MSNPQDIGNGRTIVRRMDNFVHWCAWRYWLHRETGRTFFPDKMCVWGDWPPETMHLAQKVCQTILATRRHPKVQWDFPVCDPAQPWDRWDYNEREELARHHREDLFWTPPLPEPRGHKKPGAYKTPVEIELDDWIKAQAAKMPDVPRGKGLAFLRAAMTGAQLETGGPGQPQDHRIAKAQGAGV